MNDVVVFPDALFVLKWNFASLEQKFIRNISRSKPRLFDTSIHSLMHQKLLSSLWNTHHLSKVKFQFHTIFESWETKETQPPPPSLPHPLNTLCILSIWQHSRLNKRVIVPPYKTSLPAVDDFSGEQFFNSHMNLHVCSRLFAFKLKWKILHLFVEKSELRKYLKIVL